MRRILRNVLVVVIAVTLLTGGVTLAAVNKGFVTETNIIAGNPGFELYADPELKIPLGGELKVSLGDVGQLSVQDIIFYVKTTGSRGSMINVRTVEDITGWAYYEVYPSANGTRTYAGKSWMQQFIFRIWVNEDAELGPKSFTIEVNDE